MSKLPISETFMSIQGEGREAGRPAVFLRFAGCNLQCGAVGRDLDEVNPQEDEPVEGASWVCDTIDVWREPENVYSPGELMDEFEARGWDGILASGDANLILTGGEPMLPARQEAYMRFVGKFIKRTGERPFTEVETNGTVKPTKEMQWKVDQWNVSLKLSNSGHSKEERINEEALQFYNQSSKADFKFVVSDASDLDEIEELRREYNLRREKIMLMPAGQTREQLEKMYPRVVEMCKIEGYTFSPRLHITAYGQQTGV